MKTDKQMHNIILVHVARTWERIRLKQPYEEMPQDNIGSACNAIPEIAHDIYTIFCLVPNTVWQHFSTMASSEGPGTCDDNRILFPLLQQVAIL